MATTNKSYSKLTGTTGSFNQMLRRFGVVTVMNAYVYEAFGADTLKNMKAVDVLTALQDRDGNMKNSVEINGETVTLQCKLDTLKIANVTIDGPSKTVTGGQYANPLIKYGKTGRLEMQDALGNADAIEALCGGVIEHFGNKDSHTDDSHDSGATDVLHFGSDFCGEKLIVGDSFFVDTNGSQIKVKIIFYRFLPDSIFSLTQDSEGDATVFDMNGDLLTTDILVGNANGDDEIHGVFYSVLPYKNIDSVEVSTYTTGKFTSEAKNIVKLTTTGGKVIKDVNGGTYNKSESTVTLSPAASESAKLIILYEDGKYEEITVTEVIKN